MKSTSVHQCGAASTLDADEQLLQGTHEDEAGVQLDGQVGLGGNRHYHACNVDLYASQHSVGIGGVRQKSWRVMSSKTISNCMARAHSEAATWQVSWLSQLRVTATCSKRHRNVRHRARKHGVRPAASRRECSARVGRWWCLCRRAEGQAQAPPRRGSGAAWKSTACIYRCARE